MHSAAETNEGSPLLEGATGPVKDWFDAGDGVGSRDPGDRLRRRRRQQRQPAARAYRRNRNCGVSGVSAAGLVMFAVAVVGLVATFTTIQRKRTSWGKEATLEKLKDKDVVPSVAAPATRAPRAPRAGETANRESLNGKGRPRSSKGEKGKVHAQGDDGGGRAKPNVFFIMIDDMGYGDIGYQSIDLQGVTPNLDNLAAGGIKMTQYYSMSICTPARASLMTGRYAVRYGMQYSVIQPGAPWGLPLKEKIFPQYMKDAGYETHMVGKWHVGSYAEEQIPSQRGFDTFLGYLNDEETYWSHQSWTAKLHGRKFFDFGFGNSTGYYDVVDRSASDQFRDGDSGGDVSTTSTTSSSLSQSPSWEPNLKGKYSTQIFHERVIDILKQKTPFDEEPLYMYLSHQAVHDPLGLPPEGSFNAEEKAILNAIEEDSDDEDGHLRKRFAKVLMYLDHTIGELVDYLETNGWMENSIIVVASDNGACPSFGGSNYPLRGVKHSYWEGGNKVPAFMYSTSHLPEERWSTMYDNMFHVTDWLPTIASAAGIRLEGGAGLLDGVDHWGSLVNTEMAADPYPRKEMLYNFDPYNYWRDDDRGIGVPEYPFAQGAFRSGKFKAIFNEGCGGWYTFSKKTLGEDQLTNLTTTCGGAVCTECGVGCIDVDTTTYLFDIEADPREQTNLYDVHPEIAESMYSRWVEVVFSEYMNSSYVDVNKHSYYVWLKYNWWMVPWWDQFEGVTEDPFGIGDD